MLPQVLPHHPPHLRIPKYIPYQSHVLSRPKLPSSSPYFIDIAHCVSSSVSPVQSDSPVTVEDETHSPHSPLSGSANYYYVSRDSCSFVDSPVSPVEMYENNAQGPSYPTTSHSYQSTSSPHTNYDIINSGDTMRITQSGGSYISESPSPVDAHPSTSYPHSIGAAHTQERPSHILSPSYQSEGNNFDAPSDSMSGRYSRNVLADKYPGDDSIASSNALLDQRRMSEPAVLGPTNPYATQSCDDERQSEHQFSYNPPTNNPLRPSASAYVPSLQRGASMGSLRDLRQTQFDYLSPTQPTYIGWKDDGQAHRPHSQDYRSADGLDEPISPLQPDFSGGIDPSLQYSPAAENHYGPSPPGTGTSTSSAPVMSPTAMSFAAQRGDDGVDQSPKDANSKTYSFVALPGNTVKKRPRRRYDEIERLYQCSWPDCNKAYGTLNHLNAHVTMQKHGPKRNPTEFKELRKQWRKAKKEAESPTSGPLRRASLSVRHDGHELHASHHMGSHHHSSPSVYARRASYHSGDGLPSSAPSMMSSPLERYGYPTELNRYPADDREDRLAAYSAHARQRYSGTSPASWHAGPSRANTVHQYVSSSLPSQAIPQHHHAVNIHDADSQLHHSQAQSYQYPRPQSPPMNRLPPDSMLLTPIQGYRPPSLLPPLQAGDNVHYPSDGYDVYEGDSSGRPGTGHGSDEY
ncbi:hypothetical protein Hypma_009129 [Hypsizygus marmoreus]|uniref:C2H2-type domain-containing protein n=1 Tax=Hypsizygus marmoreus TaxID=39966 RepID=A0A369JN90_HYPMA|nr:hypothetical protein Hypma_009129 [Hypsizygus marmoreus]